MAHLVQTVFPQGKTRYPRRLNVHLDSCRVHFSKVTEQSLIENQLLCVPHPPYSPDLAPSDFWLFGRIKTGIAGRSFTEPEELLECIGAFLEGIPAAELTAVFGSWIDRVRWVITHHGQHYSRKMLCSQLRFPTARPWLCRKNILISLCVPTVNLRHGGSPIDEEAIWYPLQCVSTALKKKDALRSLSFRPSI
jgi:hypothetical protein